MSRFVDECRKEWSRLGVPAAVANEMAADLAADLSEAESEGASPEEVLGNGVFDAKSFAASWATARGVVPARGPSARVALRSRWSFLVCAGVSIVVAFAGLIAIAGRRHASVAAVIRHSIPARLAAPPNIRIGPVVPISSHALVVVTEGGFQLIGVVLLVIGLLGLGSALWLFRPWSARRRRGGPDENFDLPSFL